MMQDQTRPAAASDELPWQYIVLIVVIAAIVMLAAQSPVEVERGIRLLNLSELTFTERYEDPSGISLSYPAGWEVTSDGSGQITVANFPDADTATPTQHNQMAVSVVPAPIDEIGFDSGTDPKTMLMTLATQLGMTEDDIIDLTVDGYPAAGLRINESGIDFTIVLVTPNENILIQIMNQAAEGHGGQADIAFDNLLETVTIDIPAG